MYRVVLSRGNGEHEIYHHIHLHDAMARYTSLTMGLKPATVFTPSTIMAVVVRDEDFKMYAIWSATEGHVNMEELYA